MRLQAEIGGSIKSEHAKLGNDGLLDAECMPVSKRGNFVLLGHAICLLNVSVR